MNKHQMIQTFICVVEEGSYTKAALRLEKTKAWTSLQVSQLEAYLGVKLIQRNTRRLSVTDIGEQYYQGAKTLLEDMTALESKIGDMRETIAGPIKLTAPEYFGELQICPLVAQFCERYPQIDVELHLSDTKINLIAEGFDLGVRIGALKDSRLVARTLHGFTMVVVASKSWLEEHPIQCPQDLEAAPAIIDTQHHEKHRWSFKGDVTVKVHPKHKVNSPTAAANMACAGLGVTRIPSFAATPFIQQGRLVHLLPKDEVMSESLTLLYPNRQYLPHRVQRLKDYLSDKLSALD